MLRIIAFLFVAVLGAAETLREVGTPAGLAPATGSTTAIVRLAAGTNHAWIVFETNTLLYSVACIGTSLETSRAQSPSGAVPFNAASGTVAWTNKPGPGWALANSSSAATPSNASSSRLPAHFDGMLRYGSNVVFRYTVKDCAILDLPGLIDSKGFGFFTRTLRVGASTNTLIVRLRDAGCDTLPPGVPCPSVVVLEGLGVQARLNTDRIEAVIPPHTQPVTAKFLFVDSQHGQAIPFDHLERVKAPDLPER